MPEGSVLPRLGPTTIHLRDGVRLEAHGSGKGWDIVLDDDQRITGEGRGLTAEQVEQQLDWLDSHFAGRN